MIALADQPLGQANDRLKALLGALDGCARGIAQGLDVGLAVPQLIGVHILPCQGVQLGLRMFQRNRAGTLGVALALQIGARLLDCLQVQIK